MKKVFAGALVLLLAIGGVAGCGSKSESVDPDAETNGKVIMVGVFEPTSGENGSGGFQEVLGVRYANEVYPTVQIGADHYQIKLVEVDNQSDKAAAVVAAKKLIAADVAAVIGSYGSGVSIAAGDVFKNAKVAAVGASCTNPKVTLGNDFYFRICFLDPFQGTVMANYAFQHGAGRAAIITQKDDVYSVGLGEYFSKAFKSLAGDTAVVAEEQFETGQTDFQALLSNIRKAKPDVIFAPSSIATAPLILKQIREMGITAKIMGGDTWESAEIIDNAGPAAEGIVLSTFFDEGAPATPEAEKFIPGFKEYLKANGQPETIPAVSALGYDAYLVVREAIQAAGSTDTVAIRDALEGVVFEGVTGSLSFNEGGDANKDMAFIKIVENKQFKFLKTVTVAQ